MVLKYKELATKKELSWSKPAWGRGGNSFLAASQKTIGHVEEDLLELLPSLEPVTYFT